MLTKIIEFCLSNKLIAGLFIIAPDWSMNSNANRNKIGLS